MSTGTFNEWNYTRMYRTAWQQELLTMSDADLQAIAKAPPPPNRVRGYKASAKRLLKYREMERKASLWAELQAPPHPTEEPSFERCLACGGMYRKERVIEGYCQPCYESGTVNWTPAGYVRAGDDLPPAEVFSHAEVAGLEFVKWLVANGRMGE